MTTPNNRATGIRAALEAAQQPDFGDEWHREHKGALKDVIGYEWYCGDDHCDCSQATITARFWNTATFPSGVRSIVPIRLWEGDFHTDGEPGASDELAALRRELARDDPELEAQVVWQEGVDYGG